MKLVLAIRSLDIGGAERQFIELIKHIDKTKFDIYVVTMYSGVLDTEVINIKGIKFFNLKKHGRYDLQFYFRYKKLLKQITPDVIYSFMGEMNLFSYWCKPKNTKLIWGFRSSNKDLTKYGKVSQFLFYLQKKYSKKIDKIITNSNSSLEYHKKVGFNMDKAIVIYNGIDTKRFQKQTTDFKKKYNLKTPTIAMVARVDYVKGYDVFCNAILDFDYEFIAIGKGEMDCKKVRFLGPFEKIEQVYNGIEVLVSASRSEGFSNSIAEAMACETPCIVTDVGDSKYIVGDTGIVINPNSAEELQKAIKQIFTFDLVDLGKKSRKRIVDNFSIDKMVKKTEEEICAVL